MVAVGSTDEQVYIEMAAGEVETVARKLEQLAAQLREMATRFATAPRRGGAVGVAADIVDKYTQAVGNNGTYLWGVVRNAKGLDDHRAGTDH